MMKLIIVLFLFVGYLYGESVVLTDLISPKSLAVGATKIFISDDFSIKVYSRDSCRFIRSFGRKGEGPGEFRSNPEIVATNLDQVWVLTKGVLQKFAENGKLNQAYKLPDYLSQVHVLSDQAMVAKQLDYLAGLEKIAFFTPITSEKPEYLLQSPVRVQRFSGGDTAEIDVSPSDTGLAVVGERIVVVKSKESLVLSLYDRSGKHLRDITKNISRIPVDERFKEKVMNKYKTDPQYKAMMSLLGNNSRFKFPANLPYFEEIHGGDTMMALKTFQQNPEKSTWVILDLAGEKKLEIKLPESITTKLFDLRDNTLFYLEDNDQTEAWSLQRIKIE